MVIGDPYDQWVKIFVSEDLMHHLSINQTATIAVDGSDKTYKGHVSFIADKAEFTPRNVQTLKSVSPRHSPLKLPLMMRMIIFTQVWPRM